MVIFNKLIKQFWPNWIFDFDNWASLFKSINNTDLPWFHGTKICKLCHSTSRSKKKFISEFALHEKLSELAWRILPRQIITRHIKYNEIKVIKSLSCSYIRKLTVLWPIIEQLLYLLDLIFFSYWLVLDEEIILQIWHMPCNNFNSINSCYSLSFDYLIDCVYIKLYLVC
jgi:hypothetical protein